MLWPRPSRESLSYTLTSSKKLEGIKRVIGRFSGQCLDSGAYMVLWDRAIIFGPVLVNANLLQSVYDQPLIRLARAGMNGAVGPNVTQLGIKPWRSDFALVPIMKLV